MKPLLQVISTSPLDSKTIFSHGADRIELVSALQIGGITPSMALLRKSLEVVDIPTMVMVRHHNQGFYLEPFQKELLIQEAICVCEAGGKGLVVGSLTKDNRVDEDFIVRLKGEISNKIEVTYHKASDQTNLLETYDKLMMLGVNRVLTQGGKCSIEQNRQVLKQLLKRKHMNTLLGGGINLGNIKAIVQEFHPPQVHIGTCVRRGRYGAVEGELVEQFIAKMTTDK